MADKKNLYKNFNAYYKKFSKKLIDVKYFYWMSGLPEGEDPIFYDEKSFFLFLIRKTGNKSANEASWFSSISSQPTSYGQMMSYKCLKERNKLKEATALAEKYYILTFNLDQALILKEDYDREAMISIYNDAIKTLLLLEKESAALSTEILDSLKSSKPSNNKDVYIG
jgi:hypothetical protein